MDRTTPLRLARASRSGVRARRGVCTTGFQWDAMVGHPAAMGHPWRLQVHTRVYTKGCLLTRLALWRPMVSPKGFGWQRRHRVDYAPADEHLQIPRRAGTSGSGVALAFLSLRMRGLQGVCMMIDLGVGSRSCQSFCTGAGLLVLGYGSPRWEVWRTPGLRADRLTGQAMGVTCCHGYPVAGRVGWGRGPGPRGSKAAQAVGVYENGCDSILSRRL